MKYPIGTKLISTEPLPVRIYKAIVISINNDYYQFNVIKGEWTFDELPVDYVDKYFRIDYPENYGKI